MSQTLYVSNTAFKNGYGEANEKEKLNHAVIAFMACKAVEIPHKMFNSNYNC